MGVAQENEALMIAPATSELVLLSPIALRTHQACNVVTPLPETGSCCH